jgi:hypothetical protein
MTKLPKLAMAFSLMLGACATSGPISMQILQKDNSKIHYAVWTGRTYSNAGFIEMDLGGKIYRGEPGRVNEANLFGLKSKVGTFSRPSSTSSLLTTYYRALLANDDGIGMRCDFYLDLSSGSGLCIDEKGKQFEITLLF